MHGGKSQHLNMTCMTCDIGEPDSPGPDRGKRGVMRREPLAGNTGEDLESHKPAHEQQRIAELARTKRGVARGPQVTEPDVK